MFSSCVSIDESRRPVACDDRVAADLGRAQLRDVDRLVGLERIREAPLEAGVDRVAVAAERGDDGLLAFLDDEDAAAEPDQRRRRRRSAPAPTPALLRLGWKFGPPPGVAAAVAALRAAAAAEQAAQLAVEVAPELVEVGRAVVAAAVLEQRDAGRARRRGARPVARRQAAASQARPAAADARRRPRGAIRPAGKARSWAKTSRAGRRGRAGDLRRANDRCRCGRLVAFAALRAFGGRSPIGSRCGRAGGFNPALGAANAGDPLAQQVEPFAAQRADEDARHARRRRQLDHVGEDARPLGLFHAVELVEDERSAARRRRRSRRGRAAPRASARRARGLAPSTTCSSRSASAASCSVAWNASISVVRQVADEADRVGERDRAARRRRGGAGASSCRASRTAGRRHTPRR